MCVKFEKTENPLNLCTLRSSLLSESRRLERLLANMLFWDRSRCCSIGKKLLLSLLDFITHGRKWAYAAQKQPWSLFCCLWDPYRCSGWDQAYPEHLLCWELSLRYFRVPDRLWSQGVRLLRPGLMEEVYCQEHTDWGCQMGADSLARLTITSLVAFTSWVYSRNTDGLWFYESHRVDLCLLAWLHSICAPLSNWEVHGCWAQLDWFNAVNVTLYCAFGFFLFWCSAVKTLSYR